MTDGGDLLEAIGEKFGVPTPDAARRVKGSGTLTVRTKTVEITERYDSVMEAMESISSRLMLIELRDFLLGSDLIGMLTPDNFEWKADIKDKASMDAANEIIQRVKAK